VPDEPGDLPGPDGEVEAVERADGAVALGESFGDEHARITSLR
jgi:hypothetical protein